MSKFQNFLEVDSNGKFLLEVYLISSTEGNKT